MTNTNPFLEFITTIMQNNEERGQIIEMVETSPDHFERAEKTN